MNHNLLKGVNIMITIPEVGMKQYILFVIGAVFFITVPFIIALIWKFAKKERFTTILAGAGTFLLFALIEFYSVIYSRLFERTRYR